MSGEHSWAGSSVLLGHCAYRQRGGEDVAFAAEASALRALGCRVTCYTRSNEEISERGLARGARVAVRTVWARDSFRAVTRLAHAEPFAVAHFHNTFPLLSPSVYHACRQAGVAVVQTLHNYRLVCLNATLVRAGRPCELCVGRATPWPGVVYRCYRQSRRASLAVAAMLVAHRLRGTWRSAVDAYVALSEFSRDVLTRGGLPRERIEVLPNAVAPDPGPGDGSGGYALFVGRLAPEKGIAVLLDAWRCEPRLPELRILGDGPLAAAVAAAASRDPRISWPGAVAPPEVAAAMQQAALLVAPSLCYENCPLSVVEALAAGVPIVASELGALGQLVAGAGAGVLYPPGDPTALANAVVALAGSPDRRAEHSRAARRAYLARHSPDAHLQGLLRIFDLARSRTPRRKAA
jgi:glycosyltransferase involved in cell wall biosynthesis